METATASNAKRSARRKSTYLGLAVALIVVVGAVWVAIDRNGGQDKSQLSGATLTGKKGSAVTFYNNSNVEISITETRSGITQVLHSCVGHRINMSQYFYKLPLGMAYSHQAGVKAVMQRTNPAECSVSFERAVKAQIDDLRFEVSSCYTLNSATSEDMCGLVKRQFQMTFQSAGIVGPAQRNVVLDGEYIMNGNSDTRTILEPWGYADFWSQPDPILRLIFKLDYNGQRADNGKYTYSVYFRDSFRGYDYL